MYSVKSHLDMISDEVRTGAYLKALEATIKPGMTVADIGTGIGIFAVAACQLGAERVYAFEPDPVIEIARSVARANGVEDRIEFVAELSTSADVPEPVDVVVADVNGVLPIFQTSVATLIDARDRLLKEGGVMIPQSSSIRGALVDTEAPHPLTATEAHLDRYGVDTSAARRFAANLWIRASPEEIEVVSEPELLLDLDWRSVSELEFGGDLAWTISSPGVANGLALWFSARLADGIGFDNAPSVRSGIYGQAYFPFEAPLLLEPGDSVDCRVEARQGADGYVWRWSVATRPGPQGSGPVRYEQSELGASAVSLDRLRRREFGHRTQLSPTGDATRRALELMNGSNTVAEIGARLRDDFPDEFEDERAAVRFTARLSEAHGR